VGALGDAVPLLTCELTAGDQVDAARERLNFLLAASEVLSTSLDIRQTLVEVADLLVPRLADWCSIHLLDTDGELRRVTVRHADSTLNDLAGELLSHQRINVTGDHPVGEALRTGRPQLVEAISSEFVTRTAIEPRDVELYETLGASSAIAAPLVARGRPLGVIGLTLGQSGRRYSPNDMLLVELLARRCAVAVDNAQLFEQADEAFRRKNESAALLDSLFQTAPLGLGFLDADLRYVRVNDSLAALNAIPAAEHAGRRIDEVLPATAHLVVPLCEQVLSTGQPVLQVELRAASPAEPERMRDWAASFYPVRGADSEMVGIGLVVQDITEQRQAREELQQRARQQTAVAELGERALRTHDLEQLLTDSVSITADTLSVDRASILELDPSGQVLRVRSAHGWPASAVSLEFPTDETTLPGVALRADRSVTVTEVATEDRFTIPAAWTEHGVVSLITVAIRGEESAVGVLSASIRTSREWSAYDLDFLEAVANVVGEAWARANAEAASRLARAEAEAARERESFLSEASAQLAESLDYRSTLARVARLAVPRLADWCSVEVPDEDHPELQFVVAHVDPARVEQAYELRRRYPPDPTAGAGVPNVMRTGRSEVYADIDETMLRYVITDADQLAAVQALGIRAAMIVPLVARGRTIGAVNFVSEQPERRYGPDDLSLAEDLARRAALAIDNARLYRDRSHVARTLQKSLLPPRLPQIPGVEIAARYRFAGEGNEIGGDFYDLFETAHGAWAIAIGDACGKGPEAAALTGLARHALRAAAAREPRPSRVLSLLNETLVSQIADNRFLTMAVARLEPEDGKARLVVACGGHPAPILIRAAGEVEVLDCPGMIVGSLPDATFSEVEVDLGSGDAIVFYTDGVVEARKGPEIFGEERLVELLATCAHNDARAVANAVRQAVGDFQPGPPRDDLAIVVVRVLPPGSTTS
jgi:serine phosphatase RsbU (regulator of sigma subunit)/PAS domain-containing protein